MKKGFYDGTEEQDRTVILPDIKKGKTLYWLWANKVMPVTFGGVTGGCVTDDGKYHVICEMRTKKETEFYITYRGKSVIQNYAKGNLRYFYADDMQKTIFATRRAARRALKKSKGDLAA
jgi:hypothetical protein